MVKSEVKSFLTKRIGELTIIQSVGSRAGSQVEMTFLRETGVSTADLVRNERGRLARRLQDEVASAMFAARLALDVAISLANASTGSVDL